VISREEIRDGALMRMVAACKGLIPVTSAEEMAESLDQTLASAPASVQAGGDAWIFGYGSLMWNPALHVVEHQRATLHGYHRRFCLWTPAGRGTPQHPGLVLGLDRGGSCRGVAFRIAGPQVREELAILWRREMVSDGYLPRWLPVRTPDQSIPALAFVMNQHCPRYAGKLSVAETAKIIAKATGDLGSNTEYLCSTLAHLDALGITDRSLHAVRQCLPDSPSAR